MKAKFPAFAKASAGKQIPNSKFQKGFTLIELIIYLAIISGIAVAFTYYAISITNTRAKTYVVQEVHANARTALELIGQKIRAANGFTTASVPDIGPAQVDTTTNIFPTGENFTRTTWHDGNRFWVAFYDAGQAEFWYSTNGTTWTQNTATIPTSASFSIEADEANAFIINKESDGNVYVRKAQGYPGTSFSWGPLTPVFSGGLGVYSFSVITQDSNKRIMVGVLYNSGVDYRLQSRLSTNPNDVSAWESVQDIHIGASSSKRGVIVPLSGGNMYAVWNNGTSVEGKKYTAGTGWAASAATIDSGVTDIPRTVQAVSDSTLDQVYLIYVNSAGNVMFRRYIDASGTWEGAVTLDGGITGTRPTLTIDNAYANDLYAFWMVSNTINYKRGIYPYNTTSQWDTAATALVTTGTNNYLGSAYRSGCKDIIPFIWTDILGGNAVRFYGKGTGPSIFTCNPGKLSLSMADSTKNPTIFDVDTNGILRIKEGAGAPVPITSDEVKVKNLVFTNLTGTGARENIKVQLTIEYNNPSGDVNYTYSKSFETTVSVRQ